MFWTCAEEVWRILNMELPARRKKQITEKIHGRNKGGHGEGSVTGKDTRDRVRWR